MSQPSLPPPRPHSSSPLAGAERFTNGLDDSSVLDFWRFAMGDLRTNNVRGYLAEFLVARAVGSVAPRVEWDAWDVTAPDGTKIEVKTSGFVQAWDQRSPSIPTFVVRPAAVWEETTGRRSAERTLNADVYVFCLQTAHNREVYDVLDLDQWRFYIASREAVAAKVGGGSGAARFGLRALEDIAGAAVRLPDLAEAISRRAPQQPPTP